MSNRIPHIFLSYAREDFEGVLELYNKLQAAGFKPWMDKKNILPGEKWEQSIWKAVRRSDFFLIFLSANSVNKRGFLQKEIREALNIWKEKLEDDIYLIPVRLDDSEIPTSLSEFEWVNMYEESGWESLLRSISAGMERNSQPHKLQTSSGEGRPKIENIIGEKSSAFSLKGFLTHPLVIVVSAGIIAVLLTYYNNVKQKDFDNYRSLQQRELESQQFFSNELNIIRIQKIGEVWEQIGNTEAEVDELLNKVNNESGSNGKVVETIADLIEKDVAIINKNRFWLGEQNYNRINNYVDLNRKYVVEKLLGPPGMDLSELAAKRTQAKQDIIQIRESMLSESQPGK